MPVDECTIGIGLPRPDVQRVERRQAETIGPLKIVIELSHELRRALSGMGLVPLIGQNQEIRADELKMAVGLRFINYNLRLGGIDNAAAYQGQIHVMKAHCPGVGASDATKEQRVPFGLCY